MKLRLELPLLIVLAATPALAEDPPAPPAPAPAAKHANKITDAAKAAFERMAKAAPSSVQQGLKEASGTITSEMMGMASAMKFTFTAPSSVTVETDPNLQGPMAQMGNQMQRGAERTVRMMLAGFTPAADDEYDADLVTADGKEVLKVVHYRDGAESSKSDMTLDANGLPATLASVSKMTRNGETHEMKTEAVFTWTKVGDHYRLEKMSTTGGGRMGGAGRPGGMGGGAGGMGGAAGGAAAGGPAPKVTITPTWVEVGPISVATSWKTEVEAMGMAFESKLSDLVVNGKPVAAAAPEPATPPAK